MKKRRVFWRTWIAFCIMWSVAEGSMMLHHRLTAPELYPYLPDDWFIVPFATFLPWILTGAFLGVRRVFGGLRSS
jgi:hypothetical protein